MQFDASARECIKYAVSIANDYSHEQYCLPHLFYAMVEYSDTIRLLISSQAYIDNIRASVRNMVSIMPRQRNEEVKPKKSDKFSKVETLAEEERQRRNGGAICATDLLYALMRTEDEKITSIFVEFTREKREADIYSLRKALIKVEGREDKNMVTIEEEGTVTKYSQCGYCQARVEEGKQFCCRTCELKKNLQKSSSTKVKQYSSYYDEPSFFDYNDWQ